MFNVIASKYKRKKETDTFYTFMSPNENDSTCQSHFIFHYSSNQYLLSVHYTIKYQILGN